MVKSKAFPKRGEIFWVNLDPTIGAETRKKRPGLILSNDIGNQMSSVVIVALSITSKIKTIYPFEVAIIVQDKQGKAMINQCRAVDQSRLGEKIGEASPHIMREVEEARKLSSPFPNRASNSSIQHILRRVRLLDFNLVLRDDARRDPPEKGEARAGSERTSSR